MDEPAKAKARSPKVLPLVRRTSEKVRSSDFRELLVDVLFLTRSQDYVGYTAKHLHQSIALHKNSAIGRHVLEAHGSNNHLKAIQLRVLRKCQGKFHRLVFEMPLIRSLNLRLTDKLTQTDSTYAKLFV